jgi:predicted Zn-dependent protease
VSAPRAQSYLDRLAREIARRLGLSAAGSGVILVDERRARTLGLPSGTVVLTTGMLATIEDEAELMFVLGHELAHVAAGEAGARLVAIGLRAAAQDDPQELVQATVAAASLGYGDDRELAADARATAVMGLMGYDVVAARRHLARLRPRIDRTDEDLIELALAHPTPALRARRIELAAASTRPPVLAMARVNRDIFRRAVGPMVLAADLVPVAASSTADRGRARRRFPLRVAALAGAVTLAALLLLLLLTLRWR